MAEGLILDVEPVWSEIDLVRQRAAAFLQQSGIDKDATDALAMVACELTENATKYGSFQSAAPRITVKVGITSRRIVVEVRNPVADADQGHLARLDRAVQWIRGHQDPFEVYLERLREVSAQRLDSSESGLGLVRIAYEGQAVLDFYVNEKNILAVSAMYSRSGESA